MIVSDTRINRWNLCEVRDYWNKRARDTNVARARGILLHTGLAAHYSKCDSDAAMEEERKVLFPDGEVLPMEWEDTMSRCKKFLELYKTRWAGEKWNVLQVESEFLVSLGENCYNCNKSYPADVLVAQFPSPQSNCSFCDGEIHYLLGRADLIVEDGGYTCVVDHKVTSGGGEDWMSSFAHSYQQIGYLYGLSRITGTTPKGYIINAIRFLKTFDQRSDPFLRKLFRTGTIDFKDFESNRLSHAKEIAAAVATAVPTHRKNDRACSYGGPCPFQALCWDNTQTEWWNPPAYLLPNMRSAVLDDRRDEIASTPWG